MLSVDVLIDLDTRGLPLPEDEEPQRPRLHPRLLLVVGALLVLLIPASARPTPRPVTQVFTVPVVANPQYFLESGVLYVANGGQVRAYRLTDGHELWSTRLDKDVQYFTANRAARTLLVMLDDIQTATALVLDMDTGVPLWRRPQISGELETSTDTVVFFQSTDPDPDAPEVLSAVALRTGELRWQRNLPDRRTNWQPLDPPVAPGMLGVRLDEQLQAERVDLNTGATLRTAELATQVPELAAAEVRQEAGVVGNLLLIAAVTSGGPQVYGFDATTLALRWSTTLPSYTQYAGDCGRSICLYGDGGTTLIDPVTGAVRATGDWQYAVTLPDGRLLAQADTVTVVDGTLHTVLPLGLWQVIATGPVTLLARPGHSAQETWIGVLDPGGRSIRPLQALTVGTVDSCGTDGHYLVCRAPHPGLVVFRLV